MEARVRENADQLIKSKSAARKPVKVGAPVENAPVPEEKKTAGKKVNIDVETDE